MAKQTRACCKRAAPQLEWPELPQQVNGEEDEPLSIQLVFSMYSLGHNHWNGVQTATSGPPSLGSMETIKEHQPMTFQHGVSADKRALRLLRDLLLMHLCIGRGPWSHDALVEALQALFHKEFYGTNADADVLHKSQLVLSFSKLLQLGQDRERFVCHVTSTYDTPLSEDCQQQLFELYKMCADETPVFQVSKSKKNRAKRISQQGLGVVAVANDSEEVSAVSTTADD